MLQRHILHLLYVGKRMHGNTPFPYHSALDSSGVQEKLDATSFLFCPLPTLAELVLCL
jgi:hypothetical protein